MVLLAAAIVTKSGKAVISRQFHEMQRSRIEGLLASFPKLTSTGHQHTTVETDNVRYVYQPLDDLFMVLITNRQSNILQDIESLHLFARVVTDICRSTEERDILQKSFELLCAFDEIISEGYRENVNLAQVKSIIEMESHEERIQEIIARNKEQEAKEELKRRAKQFDTQKKEASKRGQGFMQGNFSSYSSHTASSQSMPVVESMPTSMIENHSTSYNSHSSTPKAKGMQLSRKPKATELFEAIEQVQPVKATPTLPKKHQESVHMEIEEHVSLTANKDGGLEQMEVKGVLTLRVTDPSNARICIQIQAAEDSAIQFKTHPNVDKVAFKQENRVQMRDLARPFPANQNLGVVKWKYTTRDETAVPLSVTCWPSPAGNGSCDINVEYELEADHLELHDVVIAIPLPAEPVAQINHVDGSYFVDSERRVLEWQLPMINSSNKSGLLECTVPGDNADGFFPVVVSFVSDRLICDVDVLEVHNLDTNSPARFSKEVLLVADDYTIG